MTPLDLDIETNIAASRLTRSVIYQTPLERRTQVLLNTGRYTLAEAEEIAADTLTRVSAAHAHTIV